jgi:hypothetical protein
VYDLVVAAMCIVAVPVALALAPKHWLQRRLPHKLLAFLAWTGTGLLILRAGASALQIAYLIVAGRFRISALGIWEPWFYLGAVLFGASMLRYRRRRRESSLVSQV